MPETSNAVVKLCILQHAGQQLSLVDVSKFGRPHQALMHETYIRMAQSIRQSHMRMVHVVHSNPWNVQVAACHTVALANA
jgi:hypothetical protein